MPNQCRPCQCQCIDGCLAVIYVCLAMGASALLAALILDENLNHGRCAILSFNSTMMDMQVPEYFNKHVCKGFEYTAVGLVIAPILFSAVNWLLGFSSFFCWWVFQLFFGFIATVSGLVIGVVFTAVLFMFCGQLYQATDNPRCSEAATYYAEGVGSHFAKIEYRDPVEYTFYHLTVAVAASWALFFGWLLATFLILLHTCVRSYKTRIEELEQTVEDWRVAQLRDARQLTIQNYSAPPPAYQELQDEERQPLIQF